VGIVSIGDIVKTRIDLRRLWAPTISAVNRGRVRSDICIELRKKVLKFKFELAGALADVEQFGIAFGQLHQKRTGQPARYTHRLRQMKDRVGEPNVAATPRISVAAASSFSSDAASMGSVEHAIMSAMTVRSCHSLIISLLIHSVVRRDRQS
jgi:hypothetical protein